MIRIDSEFSHYFNSMIHSFVAALYYEGVDDEDRLASAMSFFPDHLRREQPEACLRVMDDLYYWTRDNYLHELDDFHQLGLYRFLNFIQEYEVDISDEEFSQIFYSGDAYNQMIDDIWESLDVAGIFGEKMSKQKLTQYLQDISLIIDSCFEDIDFITFPELLATNRDDGSDPRVVNALVDYYAEVLPQDIVARYKRRFDERVGEGLPLFQIVGELLDALAHMTEYDTLGTALSAASEKSIQYILNPLFKMFLLDYPDIHMTYEPSLAKANPDFVFQRNEEVVIVEVKLGKANIKRGVEKQLTHYMRALRSKESYMLIVCQTDKQLLSVESYISDIKVEPGLNIRPFIFNASSDKRSASIL